MIAYIEGRVLQATANACIVLTEGGVGYEVFLPTHTLVHLPARGGALALFVSHIVREDAQELYGFATWDERQTFEVLLTISKVGARTAVGILSLYRPDDLRRIVLEEDITALTRVPGIGKKTAQHVFLELKYKLKLEGAALPGAGASAGAVMRDVLDGLANLGYTEDEAGPVVRQVLEREPDLDVGSALRAALKALGKAR